MKKKEKSLELWQVVFSTTVILMLVATALAHLISLSTHEQDTITSEASGRIETDVRVFYIENESFPNNPISENLNFLMSFTDFIEMESRFLARLSEEIEVHYTYTSVKRLVVRYRGSSSGEMNPIVLEVNEPLSHVSNTVIAQEISFPNREHDGSEGTYVIFPEAYVDTFLNFVAEQERIMNEGTTSRGHASFFAELQIEFVYEVAIPDWGINERLTSGYRLPLLTEVYSIVPFGESTFNECLEVPIPSTRQIALPIVMLFVIIFSVNSYFLFTGIKKLSSEPDAFSREVSEINRKYASEIVASKTSLLQLTSLEAQYTCIEIDKFESLLNLAINTNAQIMSYRDEGRAEFVVVKDVFIYYYEILATRCDASLKSSTMEEMT